MKNLFGKIASLAVVLGFAVALTSCHRGSSEAESAPVTKSDVTPVTTRTLQVKLSKAVPGAKVIYGASTLKSSDSQVFTLENAASTGVLQVDLGTGYVPFEKSTVDFGKRTSIVIDVTVVAISTSSTKAEVVAAGGVLTNDNNNQTETKVDATLTVDPSNIDDSSASGSDYSMTVYSNPVDPEEPEEIKSGTSVTVNPLSVLCKPDNVKFTNGGATMALYVEGSSQIGKEAIHMKNDKGENVAVDKISNDTIYATVEHFSIQELFVDAVCTGVTMGEKIALGAPGTLKAGNNKVTYQELGGYKAELTGIAGLIIKALLGAEESTTTKTTTIAATGPGTYQFYQQTIIMTFQCGQLTIQVTTYGAVTYDATYTPEPEPEVPSHVGGSN